jgi:fructose-1-phosphate kinase PfkB-like protein
VIVVAGLSPAWQQVLVVDEFHSGGVNRASEAYWCGSGKVLNVAVALHQLSGGAGGQTHTLSTLGGPAYDAIEAEFAAMGVPRRWVRTQSPTRVCTTIVDRATRVATELVGPELLAALDARPFLVKPNRDELGHTLNASLESDDDLQRAVAELQNRGAQAVVVTSGTNEVIANLDGRTLRFTPRPVADAVNPIGCGDCLTAGIAWALHQGEDLSQAVEQGLECARRNLLTLIPGDINREREQYSRR